MHRTLLLLLALALVAHPAHADDGDRWDGITMTLQGVGGAGGTVVGFGIGGTIGLAIGAAAASQGNWGAPLAGAAIGGGLGGLLGLVAGVQYIGDAQGGTGKLWGTSLGLVGGALLFGSYLYVAGRDAPQPVTVVLGTVLLLGGPIIGYQLSSSEKPVIVPLVVGGF